MRDPGKVCAAMLVWVLGASGGCASATVPDATEHGRTAGLPGLTDEPPSSDARYAAHWVLRNADNAGRPFAIVDKKGAQLYVYAADGRLAGASAVLLGLATGDEPVPEIANRSPAGLAPAQRTTPAGRFASEPGHNDKGEDIVWFDYDAALAIHRLRPSPAIERRRERLESSLADVRRISFGCVVVPVAFYDEVVSPLLGRHRGVVYVLPETRPVREMFADDAVLTLR